MTPTARNRAARAHAQTTPKTNPFRVTKSAKLNIHIEISKQKLQVIEEVTYPKEKPQPKQESKKRRRETLDSDIENEEDTTPPQRALKKVRATNKSSIAVHYDSYDQSKLQLHIPPPSAPNGDNLCIAIEELKSLHKSFTQAISIHYAHNASRNAISLSELVPAMTRMWKRRTVTQYDIQRMLGVWEIHVDGDQIGHELEHQNGPFRLLATGIGAGSQLKIEYMWSESGTFIEKDLHSRFEELVTKLHKSAILSNLNGINDLPLIKVETGAQTQARKQKINSIRDQILQSPAQIAPRTGTQALDLSRLDISDPSEPKHTARETLLKSRTLSLFDRLKAKQLANSNVATPTSKDLLRQRALHRIPDIIDVLRLKQARKLSTQFRVDVYDSPSNSATSMMKVSFSLDALVREIKDSGKTNIAEEEIKECISILGREVPDTWCSVYTTGEVRCVTLQGEGWRKEEVRAWCNKELSRVGAV